LYFGAGAVKIKYRNKEVSFYDKLMDVFTKMFSLSIAANNKITEYLDKLGEETENLTQKIEDLHSHAKRQSWHINTDEYEEITEDHKLLEDHISSLLTIDSELNKEPLSQLKIKNIISLNKQRIEEIRLRINHRLKKYMKDFLLANIKNERSIDEIAEMFKIESDQISTKQPHETISRVIGISLLTGIILGIVLEKCGSGLPQNKNIFYLTFALFFYNLIISQIRKCTADANGFISSILLGAIAGIVGYFTFLFISEINIFLDIIYKGLNENAVEKLLKVVNGMIIGILIGLNLFLFKNFITIFKSSLVKYFSVGLSGCFFLLLYLFIPSHSVYEMPKYISYPILGGIISIGSAFVSGIFKE
jgi:hypothetical protein